MEKNKRYYIDHDKTITGRYIGCNPTTKTGIYFDQIEGNHKFQVVDNTIGFLEGTKFNLVKNGGTK